MKKYYLKIEIRYNYREVIGDDEDDYEVRGEKEIIHSDLYDDEKDCIALGNKLISENRWIEQYPGYQNLKLERRFGYPLVAPSLKNGAQIFIGVYSLNVSEFDKMNETLRKFNIKGIHKKL